MNTSNKLSLNASFTKLIGDNGVVVIGVFECPNDYYSENDFCYTCTLAGYEMDESQSCFSKLKFSSINKFDVMETLGLDDEAVTMMNALVTSEELFGGQKSFVNNFDGACLTTTLPVQGNTNPTVVKVFSLFLNGDSVPKSMIGFGRIFHGKVNIQDNVISIDVESNMGNVGISVSQNPSSILHNIPLEVSTGKVLYVMDSYPRKSLIKLRKMQKDLIDFYNENGLSGANEKDIHFYRHQSEIRKIFPELDCIYSRLLTRDEVDRYFQANFSLRM